MTTERDNTSDSSRETPDDRQPAGGGTFTRCPQCSMTVRRTELEIHLAHAHDIGQSSGRRDRGRRGGRR